MATFVVTTDLSEASHAAFPAAAMYFRLLSKGGGELILLSIVENPLPALSEPAVLSGAMSEEVLREMERGTGETLEKLAAQHFSGLPVRTVVRRTQRSVSEEIVDAARELGADYLVVATHGRSGLSRLVSGSVTERLLATATCPVFVVYSAYGDRVKEYPRIGVATDFSPQSLNALLVGRELQRASGEEAPPLTLLHVAEDITGGVLGFRFFDDPEAVRRELEARCEQELDNLVEEYFPGKPVRSVVVRSYGRPDEELSRFAETAPLDLLILGKKGARAEKGSRAGGQAPGANGRSGHALGSNAARLVRFCATSLLVVP